MAGDDAAGAGFDDRIEVVQARQIGADLLDDLRVAAGMGDENTLRARAEQIVVQIVRVGRDALFLSPSILLITHPALWRFSSTFFTRACICVVLEPLATTK